MLDGNLRRALNLPRCGRGPEDIPAIGVFTRLAKRPPRLLLASFWALERSSQWAGQLRPYGLLTLPRDLFEAPLDGIRVVYTLGVLCEILLLTGRSFGFGTGGAITNTNYEVVTATIPPPGYWRIRAAWTSGGAASHAREPSGEPPSHTTIS